MALLDIARDDPHFLAAKFREKYAQSLGDTSFEEWRTASCRSDLAKSHNLEDACAPSLARRWQQYESRLAEGLKGGIMEPAMTGPGDWRDDAACREADPELFFPVSTTGPALRQVQEAIRICQTCPVQTQCLAWALEQGADGVWGGTTPEQRRAIRRPARADGGFARDFATADGKRVRVAALTPRQFADLTRATRLAATFGFLERLLAADFSSRGDLYAHRVTIARLLAPWFASRTVADLTSAFAGTSVTWAQLHNPADPAPDAACGASRPVSG
jgi:WhiB family transcriptional regulator, redox-sensing transcriptional regulator